MILISEIFGPTIQGEGPLIGRPTVFVRTGGCDYQHCSWCDTLYAVLPEHKHTWEKMSPNRVMKRIQMLSKKPLLITLSGGNPAIHTEVKNLIDLGKTQGYRFVMETQGSVAREWFNNLDYLVLSPKPPSSKMSTNWDKLSQCIELGPSQTYLKVVAFNDLDFDYACEVRDRYPDIPMYLQVGNSDLASRDLEGLLARMRWLIDETSKHQLYDVTVLPQLHVLLWGNQRGV